MEYLRVLSAFLCALAVGSSTSRPPFCSSLSTSAPSRSSASLKRASQTLAGDRIHHKRFANFRSAEEIVSANAFLKMGLEKVYIQNTPSCQFWRG